MRRPFAHAIAAASILFLMASQPGCGGGGSSTTPTSGLTERVFVTVQNPGSGTLQIVDASKDQGTSNSVTLNTATPLINPAPKLMIPGANSTTLVYNAGDNDINVIDNIKEAAVAKLGATDCTTSATACVLQLPGATESIVQSSDGNLIYAAIPTMSELAFINATPNPFTFATIPATAGSCTAGKTCVPGAHRLVLSHNNNKLLVFNETLNQLEVVKTADNTVQTVSGNGLDHPAYGVFSSDDSKAYILNCGAECGGSQASVSVLDMTALTVGQTVNVDAATIATSDSTNLYVAGSNPATPGAGSATIMPLSTLTGGKQVKISDGFHQVISIFQNKVIIGARTCTTGCLSIVDPSTGSAIVDPPKGDVTAVTGITPRTVFYAAEGGEVRVYDVSTGNEHLTNTAPVIDFSGNVTSVLYVGPKTM